VADPPDWSELARRGQERYRDGESRVGEIGDADVRQRQLTRLGNAAWAVALALLMSGRRDEAREWLGRSAERYRESWDGAPTGSWGRPIGAMKARVLANDWPAAEDEARWALDADATGTASPIGVYAAVLALLVLGRDAEAREAASGLRDRDDFPRAVADALATLAAGDRAGYLVAVEDVLESFESRDDFLEDVPVADTVLVLQALAARRELAVDLPASALLPD
jgi:hypothetical protein